MAKATTIYRGRLFAWARRQKDYSQAVMAKVLGLDQPTLCRIERGTTAPTHEIYEALQRLMSMTLQELVVQSREDLAHSAVTIEKLPTTSVPHNLEQLLFRKTTCEHDLMDLDQELAALELRLLTAKDEATLYECERNWLEAMVEDLKRNNPMHYGVDVSKNVEVHLALVIKKYQKELLQLRANKNVLSDAELFRLEYRVEELKMKRAWLEQKVTEMAEAIGAEFQQVLEVGQEQRELDSGEANKLDSERPQDGAAAAKDGEVEGES